jgi:NAD+ synthase (glutamine-hydrolysing)
VLANGTIAGMVPKAALPNYGEYYERRWFVSGEGVDARVRHRMLGDFRVCARQIFRLGGFSFGIEVCEDLWAPAPPGAGACLAGAELIVNLSASNELVAKADYRRDLVRMASAQWLAGYLYAGAGPTESSKDAVFGGDLLAAENGQVIGEGERFSLTGARLIVEFDVARLRHDRMQNTTFGNATRPTDYTVVETGLEPVELAAISRAYPRHPFVPDDEAEFDARAAEILAIQSTGLARRMLAARAQSLVIGLSGGLDSTLALLVCLDALAKRGAPAARLVPVTMPGPGTSAHTLETARQLCVATGSTLVEIPIGPAVAQHLADLGRTSEDDVVFENAQARERTQLLFNLANKEGGLVVGTGDLSELALGWCTFNADHMASYNVNASVPKTMMAYLVRWYARHRAHGALPAVLERVLATPISPELIKAVDGGIAQHTEEIVGPYELHDFFLYHFVRNGFGAVKICLLAERAFTPDYDLPTIRKWLKVFFQRFFAQQFKRTTLPPGPKVGTVSLSPRGDWRMPDEADATTTIAALDAL